jgi:crotonobetainyl-CoA:carnitine CoA-transferase CaiB-like acyl-CoA transferase
LETAIYGGERWLNITISNDKEWKAFCNVIGNPDWTKDEMFSTQKGRYQKHKELDGHIENWTRTRDNFEAFYVLQHAGVPAGPVYDYRDAHMCPQLNFRNFFQTISSPDAGTYRYPGFPWKFSETPLVVRNPVAGLGEHNDYVYREVMGLTEKEISDLSKKKIIGDLKYNWAGPTPEHVLAELDPKIIVV